MATTYAAPLDERGFRRVVDVHRAELHAHCYRMLGSFHDAEDALQDTLLRAWRGLPGFDGRSSLRTWLFRIATNACLDAIARRPSRVLPVEYGPPTDGVTSELGEPLVETVWVEPYPDDAIGVPDGLVAPHARYEQREAVELAFIAALQHLPAKQRAVLILREVLGFSAQEVSGALGTSVPAVNSALQRARKALDERLPDRSQQETLRQLGDDRVKELVDAFVNAWMRRDVETLTTLLAEDVVFSMPPWPIWWRGIEDFMALLERGAEACPPSRQLVTRSNGQPAIAYYALNTERGAYLPSAIDVLTLDGERIVDITGFVMPQLFAQFGLPAELVTDRL